jgi:hypothetical protein
MDNLPPRSLLNDVFQILDSRIQYIEYQSSKLSRQSLLFHKNNPATNSSIGTGSLTNAESLFSIEMTFKQIELHNRSLKLLLLLRKNLTVLNAPIIFELLTDSKFLDYDEEELTKQLCVSESSYHYEERSPSF